MYGFLFKKKKRGKDITLVIFITTSYTSAYHSGIENPFFLLIVGMFGNEKN